VLRQVAEGVLIHGSEFLQSNAVVVRGRAGLLLIDLGVHGYEMAALANDQSDLGQTVVAGFSTHPHAPSLMPAAKTGHTAALALPARGHGGPVSRSAGGPDRSRLRRSRRHMTPQSGGDRGAG
jgi:hypothetical protein